MQSHDERREDKVIGLRCREWPKEIWKAFSDRKLLHLNCIIGKLKGLLIVTFMSRRCYINLSDFDLEKKNEEMNRRNICRGCFLFLVRISLLSLRTIFFHGDFTINREKYRPFSAEDILGLRVKTSSNNIQ